MRKIITSMCMALALQGAAQTLHKDITVEQTATPQTREAARIGVLPEVWLPALSTSPLDYSDKVVSARVPNSFTLLEPVAYGMAGDAPQYRGYVRAGVFPLFNAEVSAGFRLIDNSTTRLTAWGEYDAAVYHRGHYAEAPTPGLEHGAKMLWRDHTATVGVDLHQAIGKHSTLDAGADYTYARHNQFYRRSDDRFGQSAQRVNFNATFGTMIDALKLSARLGVQHFGFYKCHPVYDYDNIYGSDDIAPAGIKPQRQNRVLLGVSGELPAGDNSKFGLDADLDLLRTVRPFAEGHVPFNTTAYLHKAGVSGVFKLTPYYQLGNRTASVRLGLDADVAIGSGKTFRLAPDVRLAWTPSQQLGIEVKGTGGTQLNSLADLYAGVTPYLNPTMAYGKSHVPYALEGKITAGPFHNATLELFGGYARTTDYLMPVMAGFQPGGAAFESLDVKGYRLGVALGYDNGNTFALKASYMTAPGKHEKAWFEWRDRARHVLEAKVSVRPVKPLVVELDYTLRAGRCMYGYNSTPDWAGAGDIMYFETYRMSLGTVSELNAYAGYAVNTRLNVFVRGLNLMSRTYSYIGGHPSRGISGLVGLSYKF